MYDFWNDYVKPKYGEQKKLSVYYCHVTYLFQSESTLYICLNVKEPLARSRREI